MNKVRLRPSQIKNFLNCRYKWYRDCLSDKPIRKVSSKAYFGSSVHKAAEAYYNECINTNKWQKPNSELPSIAIDTWRKLIKEDSPSDLKELNLNSIETSLIDCSNAYLKDAKEFNPSIPIAVEKYYSIKVNSPIIDEIGGTLDIVGKDFVGDIKTSSKKRNPIDYALQQVTYALLREGNNETVKDLIIHRVNTKTSKVDSVSILGSAFSTFDDFKSQTKTILNNIVKTANNFHKSGDESLFTGNPYNYLCSPAYCAYYSECPYRKLI